MKNPPFDSLVWGSLRLVPIIKFTLFVCLPQFLSGEVLGVLCQHCGPDVYVELQSVLVSGIENNIERDAEAVLEHPELLEKLSHSSSSSSTSDGNERVSQIWECFSPEMWHMS